jgi:hypothetical protein
VLSLTGDLGRLQHDLTKTEQQRIGEFFGNYKKHEPGNYSKVPGWGSAADGRAHVRMTHAFFRECGQASRAECRIGAPAPPLPAAAAAAAGR